MAQVRLQKIVARAGIASRRAAETLIKQGHVRVNGKIVTELGTQADPTKDKVEVDQRRIVAEPLVYVVIHKPKKVVSTLADPEGRESISDYVERVDARVHPIGRLDFHTSGVLLLTNDGEFTHGLLHPRKQVPKVYVVKVQGEMTEATLDRWRSGVELDDGITQPCGVSRLRYENGKTWIEVTLYEGRNQQIRRMGDATDHQVMRLARVSFAGVTTEGLGVGQMRSLTRQELIDIKKQYGVPKRVPSTQTIEDRMSTDRSRARFTPHSSASRNSAAKGRAGSEDGNSNFSQEKPEERRSSPRTSGRTAPARSTETRSSAPRSYDDHTDEVRSPVPTRSTPSSATPRTMSRPTMSLSDLAKARSDRTVPRTPAPEITEAPAARETRGAPTNSPTTSAPNPFLSKPASTNTDGTGRKSLSMSELIASSPRKAPPAPPRAVREEPAERPQRAPRRDDSDRPRDARPRFDSDRGDARGFRGKPDSDSRGSRDSRDSRDDRSFRGKPDSDNRTRTAANPKPKFDSDSKSPRAFKPKFDSDSKAPRAYKPKFDSDERGDRPVRLTRSRSDSRDAPAGNSRGAGRTSRDTKRDPNATGRRGEQPAPTGRRSRNTKEASAAPRGGKGNARGRDFELELDAGMGGDRPPTRSRSKGSAGDSPRAAGKAGTFPKTPRNKGKFAKDGDSGESFSKGSGKDDRRSKPSSSKAKSSRTDSPNTGRSQRGAAKGDGSSAPKKGKAKGTVGKGKASGGPKGAHGSSKTGAKKGGKAKAGGSKPRAKARAGSSKRPDSGGDRDSFGKKA
jgi:23S rRNA pseudouridine2605 synthase